MKRALEEYAIPFESDEDFSTLIDSIGDAKIVLLGEASHGTSEFYTIRAQLTKRLIEEKGFSIIAVEGDWPACQQVNRHIKGFGEKIEDTKGVMKAFNRWPTWMWANEDVLQLIESLKLYNEQLTADKRIGFYGIDMYSLWESMEELLTDLIQIDSPGVELELSKKILSCLQPFYGQSEEYAISTAYGSESCEEEVTNLLSSIRDNYPAYSRDQEQSLNIMMNALVLKNAEAYYRTSTQRNSISWNIRDTHMVEAINVLREFHGNESKIIVWEHNTHIGDARATTMKEDGSINVGQLIREQNKREDVYAIGFGTHRGTVIAAEAWGDPYKVMDVPPAKNGSWEDSLHKAGAFNKFLIFNNENRLSFTSWIDHRAIGVVYNPAYEKYNYVPSQMGNRYDAFIHIDETNALKPLDQ